MLTFGLLRSSLLLLFFTFLPGGAQVCLNSWSFIWQASDAVYGKFGCKRKVLLYNVT